MSVAKTPLVIIVGFLGAGKTTFLREIIPLFEGSPCTPYIILNDFINAEIDSAMLREVANEVRAISGGCVCCDSAENLKDELASVPLEGSPVVFVEANGTTDPFPLLELLTLDPELAGRYEPVFQIAVINEARWQKRFLPWDRAIERAQAATASHIFTNRSQSASLKQQQRLRKDLSEINPNARASSPRELAAELLSQPSRARLNPSSRLGHSHQHVAVRVALPPLREETLVRWLGSFPPEVLRIKGFVPLLDDPEHPACFFQRTDDDIKRPNIIKTTLSYDTDSCAVFIGRDLDADKITRSLQPYLEAEDLPPLAQSARKFRFPGLPRLKQR